MIELCCTDPFCWKAELFMYHRGQLRRATDRGFEKFRMIEKLQHSFRDASNPIQPPKTNKENCPKSVSTYPQKGPRDPPGQPGPPWPPSVVWPFALRRWSGRCHRLSKLLPSPTPAPEQQQTWTCIRKTVEISQTAPRVQKQRVAERSVPATTNLHRVVKVVCRLHEALEAIRFLGCHGEHQKFP